jgi:hypothetical protein
MTSEAGRPADRPVADERPGVGDRPRPTQRVSPISSPPAYRLPGRPDGASAAALDAYRQLHFLLGEDLHLFEEAMNLQLRLVRDSYPSRYRTHELAALMPLWSRTYAYLDAAALLLSRGEYAAAIPLIRAACESLAAQVPLCGPDAADHHAWLAATLRPHEELKAFEFALGRHFSGETLASDPVLRAVYRPASDLSRPNFGASLLQVAPESNNVRLAITFADASFHLGWAEVILGWLLVLAARQIRLALEAPHVFAVGEATAEAYRRVQRRVDTALARGDRCAIDEVEVGGERRYLVRNFRRAASASPRRILL